MKYDNTEYYNKLIVLGTLAIGTIIMIAGFVWTIYNYMKGIV